jgi:AcrR family transcriptional regulator
MVSKYRARRTEDKLVRREAILAAALALWSERSFATLTMAEVAECCGLAKGTLYLYFATKEELLLALLERELSDWFAAIDGLLGSDDTSWDTPRVTEVICATLAARVAFIRLLTIAPSILEYNISPARALAYKELTLRGAATTGALLERRLPFLAPGEGGQVLISLHALVIGLRQMADPGPVVAAVLARPEMAPLRVEFDQSLRTMLATLLRGLESRQET